MTKLSPEKLEQLYDAQLAETELFAEPNDLQLLQLLAAIDRDRLAEMMTEANYEAGEFIFHENEEGNALYLIWAGRVAVIKGDIEKPTVLGYRGPGETIGEMTLLDDQPRSASVVALEDVRLLRVSRAAFHGWLDSTPAIGKTIMALLSNRLRAADTVRTADDQMERQLVRQVSRLQTEKEHLLELQRVRQETSDLVVHDLRNPLGVIAGALNMLEVVLPTEVLTDNRDILDLALSACNRMQRLVESLLDVARLDTGEMGLTLAETDLCPLLRDAPDRAALSAKNRQVTLEARFPNKLPAIVIDAEKMERVLANLIDNAIKYTPAGGTITLNAQAEDDGLVISVTDSGPGIPAEDRERIFKRFAQGQPSEGGQRQRRGFGLGLTFCKLTIEAHGGAIWAEEGPNGTGSRFVFTLPF
jgi:signal transduction histidine kinase